MGVYFSSISNSVFHISQRVRPGTRQSSCSGRLLALRAFSGVPDVVAVMLRLPTSEARRGDPAQQPARVRRPRLPSAYSGAGSAAWKAPRWGQARRGSQASRPRVAQIRSSWPEYMVTGRPAAGA